MIEYNNHNPDDPDCICEECIQILEHMAAKIYQELEDEA